MAIKTKKSVQATLDTVEAEKSALLAEIAECNNTLQAVGDEITRLLAEIEPLEQTNRGAHLLLSQKKITIESVRVNAQKHAELSGQINLWEIQYTNCNALIAEKQKQVDELDRRLSQLDRLKRTFMADELVQKIRKTSGANIDELNLLLQGLTPFGQSSTAILALKLTGG